MEIDWQVCISFFCFFSISDSTFSSTSLHSVLSKIYPSKVSLWFTKICVIGKQLGKTFAWWSHFGPKSTGQIRSKVRNRIRASKYIEVIPTVLSWSWMPHVKILTFFELCSCKIFVMNVRKVIHQALFV